MSLKFFDKLSQNFIELLNDKDDNNVIIEWEISQNPTLLTNLEEWSEENFLTLETTLQ
ncbi:hypothetical protein Glove_1033g12 [Diversispora epigaea]|uniref:Uncharacterized protein n=1 Tax=Diversispora epigaea TaxID=1348612 RepID=A0A397G130_9GLOM|nr:hypothetical protein Glove_1033g12 [Diversispora epigaea]